MPKSQQLHQYRQSHKITLIIGSKLHSSHSTGEHLVLGQSRQEVSYVTGVVACTDICLLSLAIWGGLLPHVLLKIALYIVKTYSERSISWYMHSTNIHPHFQSCQVANFGTPLFYVLFACCFSFSVCFPPTPATSKSLLITYQ